MFSDRSNVTLFTARRSALKRSSSGGREIESDGKLYLHAGMKNGRKDTCVCKCKIYFSFKKYFLKIIRRRPSTADI